MATVEVDRVTVRRRTAAGRHRRNADDEVALRSVTLDIADGTVVGVVGPSGSGKTTLLRVIAGLDVPDEGTVRFDGVDVTRASPAARDVAMVFQSPVLMPRRDVGRNVAFPLEIRHLPPSEVADRVRAEVRALHIEHLLRRAPTELSAGEQQVVQIARSLVRVPAVLLLDEPLALVDPAARARLRAELKMLQDGYGVTTVVATNDHVEAMVLPHRLVVLEAGSVVQVGTPLAVYHDPATLAAATATGEVDLSRWRVRVADRAVVADRDGTVWHPTWIDAFGAHDGATVFAARRPDGATRWFDAATGGRLR